MKKRPPYIPPGAPGHPLEGGRPGARGPGHGRGPLGRPKGRSSEDLDGGPPGARGTDAPGRRGREPRRERAKLLYQDEDILVYDKPSGLPVIPPEGSRSRCLLDIATEEVRRRNPKGRAAVVHRIDRDTSGTVVFARSARIKKELMEGWDELVSERRYAALVEGPMGAEAGVCDSWLKENRAGEVFVASPGERGAKRAITRWKVLSEGSGLSLLELHLETGRKHQIRVQLAAAGHPVVGDRRYGSPRNDRGPDRLCLHAASIALSLPGRETLAVASPIPPEFAAALGRGGSVRGGEGGASPLSGRRASSGASRPSARSGDRPRPPSYRGRKPASRA